mgnify:CR=1 FL=1
MEEGELMQNHAFSFTGASIGIELNQPMKICIFHLSCQNTLVWFHIDKPALVAKVEEGKTKNRVIFNTSPGQRQVSASNSKGQQKTSRKKT